MTNTYSGLTPRQQSFVDHFLVSLNATQAAKAAGYSDKSARQQASALLTNPSIQEAIDEKRREREFELKIESDRVIKEVAALAFTDLMDMVDIRTGEFDLSKFDKLPRYAQKAVRRVTHKKLGSPDSEPIITTTIELHDKVKALELLMKYFGLLNGAGSDTGDGNNKRTDITTILEAARRIATSGE